MTWRAAIGWRARADHELTSAEAVRELRRKLGPPTPHLRIYRSHPGWWCWNLDHGDGTGQGAAHESWGAALAVGLAALEAASVERISP